MTLSERRAVFLQILPGLLLVSVVSLVSAVLARVQQEFLGSVWLGTIVLAILLGAAFHTAFGLAPKFHQGVKFCAKWLLELAVCLMGASVSFALLQSAGWGFITAIMGVVVISILVSYGIGRALGLTSDQSILVACGNSICGNSAIASVAAIIGAKADDVASSIAFTAVLGVAVALVLPLAQEYMGLSLKDYGILAGMLVYAVPQVLAATMPVGQIATQMGTLTKLVRVLMLGPILILVALGLRRQQAGNASNISLNRIVPWFIIGFFALMAARSMGLITQEMAQVFAYLADSQTILAMAALGLTVNLRTLAQASGKIIAAATLSLVVLGGLSWAMIVMMV